MRANLIKIGIVGMALIVIVCILVVPLFFQKSSYINTIGGNDTTTTTTNVQQIQYVLGDFVAVGEDIANQQANHQNLVEPAIQVQSIVDNGVSLVNGIRSITVVLVIRLISNYAPSARISASESRNRINMIQTYPIGYAGNSASINMCEWPFWADQMSYLGSSNYKITLTINNHPSIVLSNFGFVHYTVGSDGRSMIETFQIQVE